MRFGILALLALLLLSIPVASASITTATTANTSTGNEDCSPDDIINRTCHPVCYGNPPQCPSDQTETKAVQTTFLSSFVAYR